MTTTILSVERDHRRFYLTCDKHQKGVLAVISLGSPQHGDTDIDILDVTICKNIKAAKKWYQRQMKTRPWNKNATTQTFQMPESMGNITGVEVKNGKLIANTESGIPMVIPVIFEK